MKTVLTLLNFVLLGVCVMSGMRLVEWAIDRPPQKILVCMASDTGDVEVCESLDKLRKRGVQM